jgi:uncharacterized membrane protein
LRRTRTLASAGASASAKHSESNATFTGIGQQDNWTERRGARILASMQAIRQFFKTTLIGGLIVVLPIAIFAAMVHWLVGLVIGLLQPLAKQLTQVPPVLSYLIVAAAVLGLCFAIGVAVRTSFGRWLHETVEGRILSRIPGYKLIRETVLQFVGNKKSPFSSVALVRINQADVYMTAFITDEHADRYTVFVPTGPNPTSGNIYHLAKNFVCPIDVPVEDAMRSIISCGAGSQPLVKHLKIADEG